MNTADYKTMMQNYDLVMTAWPDADRYRRMGVRKVTEYLRNRFCGRAYASSMLHAVELGCGRGEFTKYLSIIPFASITVVDRDLEMIQEIGRKEWAEAFSPTFKSVVADGVEFFKTAPSNFYDVFASAWTVHNIPRDQRAELFKGIFARLNPGGLFVNIDKYAFYDSAKTDKALSAQIASFKIHYKGRSDLVRLMSTHEREDFRPEYRMDEYDMKRDLERAGFTDVRGPLRHSETSLDGIVTAQKPILQSAFWLMP
jgi:tRNA (cmo5U34)-methyltransferase